MRYKKGTLYYIESTCRRLGVRYDIENDRFIPEREDRVKLTTWYIDHYLKGLTIGLSNELNKIIAKRNIISEEYKNQLQNKKEST